MTIKTVMWSFFYSIVRKTRPTDLEQRAGRIVRQGNTNEEVDIFRYVTEETFDAYMYQILESKQKFISQIMTSKAPVRVADDVDEAALSYAEIKALATGNPKIMEKMQLDSDTAKLKLQKASHLSQKYILEDKVLKTFPKDIANYESRIKGFIADIKTVKDNTFPSEKGFSPMNILGNIFTQKAEAGKQILDICKRITTPDERELGGYRGLKTSIGFDTLGKEFYIVLKGNISYKTTLGQDPNGIITRLDNTIESMKNRLETAQEQLLNTHTQLQNAKEQIETPFPLEEELDKKLLRLNELNIELNMDMKDNEIAPEEEKEDVQENTDNEREER